MPGKLVLCRHGQSIWNLENLFTGWVDVDLSAQGRAEAAEVGEQEPAHACVDVQQQILFQRQLSELADWVDDAMRVRDRGADQQDGVGGDCSAHCLDVRLE